MRVRFGGQAHVVNMGGPGDHWYTDIFVGKRSVFGEPVDSYVRDIKRFGGDPLLQLDQPLARRLESLWPQWSRVDEPVLRQLATDLASIRDDLRADAEARGWEIE